MLGQAERPARPCRESISWDFTPGLLALNRKGVNSRLEEEGLNSLRPK